MEVPRLLGRIDGERSGPTLVCIGGMHGNEPAGVLGVHRVLEGLSERSGDLRGRFVALAGNRRALREGRRFIDEDLNRVWSRDRIRALVRDPSSNGREAEVGEQAQLLAALEEAVEDAGGPVFVLDIHTTSGRGGPFSTVADTLQNRSFALHLPSPLILGLEELVDGTLLEHLGNRGFVAAVFEAGQHDEPRAVDRAEAAIWIAVAAAGLLPEGRIPELSGARKLLGKDTRELPRVLEMRHRHPVEEGDGFRMRPGYRNFQPVREGEHLGDDVGGPVRAPESARILMPLYQAQGEDGFFVVREFQPFWLHLSFILRKLRLDRVVHWLPGIRRHPRLANALVVDRRVARFYALQILHLLGFRKHVDRGNVLVVLRRRFGATAPGQPVPATDEADPGPGDRAPTSPEDEDAAEAGDAGPGTSDAPAERAGGADAGASRRDEARTGS